MYNEQLLADTLKAMAHPVRLQILGILKEEGEACVCHLEARLNLRQAYLSQQLARLRQANLVEDRRDGMNVFYRISSADVANLLASLKEVSHRINPGIEITPMAKVAEMKPCPCPNCQGNDS